MHFIHPEAARKLVSMCLGAVVCRQTKKQEARRLSLPLLLLLLAAGALALQDLLTVLVELELGDDNLGGSDGDGNRLAVALLADDCVKT